MGGSWKGKEAASVDRRAPGRASRRAYLLLTLAVLALTGLLALWLLDGTVLTGIVR